MFNICPVCYQDVASRSEHANLVNANLVFFHSSFIDGSLVLSYLSAPGRQCACLVPRPRGGLVREVGLHRPCTPRVGNLYSVTRTPGSPGGACHRMQGSRGSEGFAGFNPVVVYRSVPGRAVCLSVSVPVWFRGRGGGWCSSLRPCTPRMSWGTPHGRAVAPKMIKLRRSSIVACYRNLSSIVACNRNLSSSWASLSGALGSVPAGWVRLRPALGFRFRRFGVEKEI